MPRTERRADRAIIQDGFVKIERAFSRELADEAAPSCGVTCPAIPTIPQTDTAVIRLGTMATSRFKSAGEQSEASCGVRSARRQAALETGAKTSGRFPCGFPVRTILAMPAGTST